MTFKNFNRHKFHAQIVERDGFKFASKREARYYDQLQLRKKAGEVIFFLRQIPFHLPGGVVLRIDFQEFRSDGSVHFVDAKGPKTEQYKAKKRMVEAIYPVIIEEI